MINITKDWLGNETKMFGFLGKDTVKAVGDYSGFLEACIAQQENFKAMLDRKIFERIKPYHLPQGAEKIRVKRIGTKPPKIHSWKELKSTGMPGRANYKDECYFYGAYHVQTAIPEVRIQVGDYLTVASYKPRKEIELADFVGFSNDSDEYIRILADLILSSFMEHIEDPSFYKPTQYITSQIKSEGFHGIRHLSSRYPGQYNIVLFDYEDLENIEKYLRKLVLTDVLE